MKMVKVITGKFYMKSGTVIPFATACYTEEDSFSFNITWDDKGQRITSVEHWNSVPFDGIGIVNFISFSRVECMVADNQIEITEDEFNKRTGV